MAKVAANVLSILLTIYAVFVLANAVMFPKHDLRATIELYSAAFGISAVVEAIAVFLYWSVRTRPKSICGLLSTLLSAVWFAALSVYVLFVFVGISVFGGRS
jgi:hypothetical protein